MSGGHLVPTEAERRQENPVTKYNNGRKNGLKCFQNFWKIKERTDKI